MEEYDFSNLPEGVIQVRGTYNIMYHMMLPDIEEILIKDQNNRERIEDILDVLLDVIEDGDLGKDEFFKLLELENKIDIKAADEYMILFESIIKNKTQ